MRKARSATLRRAIKATFAVALLVFGISTIIWMNQDSSSSPNPYINISNLPESFMNEYLSDYAEVASSDNKQNMLIVTSLEPLEKTFGAKNVINAANNQYFLEFASAEEKELAYNQLNSLPNLTVAKNTLRTYYDEPQSKGGYNSWGIEKMGLDHAKELVESYPGKSDVLVTILDTGLDVNLFNQNYQGKLAGTFNVQANNTNVKDEVGHGTHIAGTIAEGTPSNVKILSVKMSSTREIYSTDIIAAIDYMTYYTDTDVVNMSFGGYIYEEAEYLAVEAAKEKGIIILAAAGNESTSERSYPAAFDTTISISAVDSDLKFAEFSNYSPTVDFAMPGVDILSINGTMSGTSMATPHAVAAAAIARSFNHDFTQEDVIKFFKSRSVDLGMKGKDSRFGWGFVDFNGASLCKGSSESCDEFSIFETDSQTGIEIAEPVLTKYNYGSLTNILATKIKFTYASGVEKTKSLGDLGYDAKITGYNPYATGQQEVTVKYEGYTATFTVENPSDWQSGWKYDIASNGNDVTLSEYRDHGLGIKTLYLPETIDGHTVTATASGCLFNGTPEDAPSWWTCEYPDSKDAALYETLIIPASIKNVRGFSGQLGAGDNRLQNLYQVIGLGDEITVTNMSFAYLKNLVSINVPIRFEDSPQPFAGDESLKEITIADGEEIVPTGAFEGCKSLEVVNLPNSLKTINERAFYETGIKTLRLGNSVQTISSEAFAKSALEELYVSSTVTYISNNAFNGTYNLETIEVDSNNPIYDSRDSSNAIILTSENKLVVGSMGTVIPTSVKTIGENSFRDSMLMEIEIPEGVTTIEANAFAESFYLMKVLLPRSINSIDDTSFNMSGMGTPSRTVFWVWNNSYAKNRVEELTYPYVLRDGLEEDPPLIANAAFEVIPEGYQFSARETITPDNFVIKIYYYDEENDTVFEEPEIISDFETIYNNGYSDALIGGYNTATFVFDTVKGYKGIKIDLNLFASFLEPEYEVPTGITAYSGQALSEIELPEGFSWVDESEFVDESKTEYLAKFTPADQDNYMVVDNIPITITVKTGTTFAEIFPDEALRACIIENLNEQKSASYTQETVNVDDVFSMTELNCANDGSGESISNTRGIERMTNLKTLNLSNNAVEKINVSKNTNLESLNLRGNQIAEINLENNAKLADFQIDSTDTGELARVNTSTYAKAVYDDEDVPHLVMDISELEFLKDADFTMEAVTVTMDEHWDISYNPETNIVSFEGQGMLGDIKVTINPDDGGDPISFIINAKPRSFYFTVYFDDELFEKDAQMMYAYTNVKVNIREIANELMQMFGKSGYMLDGYEIADADDYVVGTSDVRLTLRYKKIASDDPTDPGTNPGTDPAVDPGTGEEPGANDPTTNPQTYDGFSMVVAISAIAFGSFVLLSLGRRIGRMRNR